MPINAEATLVELKRRVKYISSCLGSNPPIGPFSSAPMVFKEEIATRVEGNLEALVRWNSFMFNNSQRAVDAVDALDDGYIIPSKNKNDDELKDK